MPRGLLLWAGKPGYDKILEALENRLNRKIGAFAVVQCLVVLDTKLLKM